ncbi:MAG: DUF4255 domain-containing protein [Clostridiales Family XIII bacterium]|jgi:hypothetical protein|nr:DUF4255 domain-containing protein [Clostridiales Family XIII bacterium]
MADYSIISDMSSYIVRLLRERMVPEPIPSPNNIEVSSPTDQEVDYLLGLHLYDIAEEMDFAGSAGMYPVTQTKLQKKPKPYGLYYMLFINSSSQMGLKAQDIQKIIGRAAQIVNDGSVVQPRMLQPWLETDEAPILIQGAKMSFDEKVRVWSAINKPYQISMFYKVSPVMLSSEIVIDPPRVREAEFFLDLERRREEAQAPAAKIVHSEEDFTEGERQAILEMKGG